jgi:hypothetical protein
MRYITGIYALNLTCPLETDGDWHYSAIDWADVPFSKSEDSRFGNWGICEREVPEQGKVRVADHVRALLDCLEQGYLSDAQGMREDFINNEDYTPVIFEKVWMLRDDLNWNEIDKLMGKEYLSDWLDYKDERRER